MTTPAPKKGLGKGLSALMSEGYSQTVKPPVQTVRMVATPNALPLDRIHSGKFQPRTRFTEEYLHELADSIEKNGVMQPIVVRPSPGREGFYEIIAGERRWRASKLAKMATIPAIVREVNDQQALELALVENVQRQDLGALEEARGYQRLIDEFQYTQEALAGTVGKSRSHIANLLRLLSLPESISKLLEEDKITMGHARALLNAKNPEAIAKQVVEEGLSVRQAEMLAKGIPLEAPAVAPQAKAEAKKPAQAKNPYLAPEGEKDADIIALEESLSQSLGLKVSIFPHSAQKGEVVIGYGNLSQLDEILRRLGDSI